MIKQDLIASWRNIQREKFYSALNIMGLAAALCCSALIGVWVWDEWRRDRYFPNADRIVRVSCRITTEKESFDQAVTSVQVAPNMYKDYPEIEGYCRIDANEAIVKVGNQQFAQKNILTADSSFFEVFNYALHSGNPRTALTEPYTIVLTESLAKKYFGSKDPIGQTLSMSLYDDSGQGRPYRVTGVLEGEPRPSHFDFEALVSFSSFFEHNPEYFGEDGWYESSYYSYLLLRPDANVANLQAKMPSFFQKYLQPLWNDNTKAEFGLQALSDIYLYSNRRYEIGDNGNASNLYIFSTVSLLILIVAGINYVNMAIARAAKRARNVGVRKALGAQRGQLALQFLMESVLTAMFAAGLAVGLAYLTQPIFEQMTGKPLGLFDVPYLPLILGFTTILLGLGAGVYPALVLSGYSPTSVLKGSSDLARSGNNPLRKGLVITQFSISIALIISVLTIRGQLDFIQHKNLGYEKDAVLTLRATNPFVQRGFDAFRNDVLANPALIRGMAISNVLPVGGTGNSTANTVDMDGKNIITNIYRMRIDCDYAPVMGLKFLAGRNFSRDFVADWPTDTTQNYLLNAAAVQAFGWQTPDQAIGKPFMTHGRKGQVVGIVEDFHFNSLKHKVEPLCIHLATHNFSQILLRIDASRPLEAITAVEATWKQHFPEALFDHAFLDEQLEHQYRSDLRFGGLFGAFSIFSIFIACLGLFGLSAYTAERRTKEIGIRKVLGASVSGITRLLVQDFIVLVLISIVLASPVAYFFMQKWLSDFAYHIKMQWWMFIGAGLLAVLIAILTVSGQALKAAWANPVKSLRSE